MGMDCGKTIMLGWLHLMKYRIKIIFGCIALLFFGVGLGWLLTFPFPDTGGGGQGNYSPDEKWSADAMTLHDSTILHGKRTFYEFTIRSHQTDSVQTVRRVTIEDTASPAIDWREQGRILWATNSSAVTFTFDGNK